MSYFLITFANTHTAISTQKFLTGKINFCIMPTLRELSQSCGISIRINLTELDETQTLQEMAYPIIKLMDSQSVSSNLYQLYYIQDNQITPIPS
ncbi:DUF3343 domain-containing protein [Velocimicrobium porci]|uniref:DUF3343 domain-containing protein n=1 Tax=Velocimicrobium porci TaxID=2606634 RepID=A0A6L5XWT5_9FIRM|nr:DUF3343 domain-containing protein [Velocimicrobium porci]MSS62891.1 DUF3343 domain-containing protein [Velocimicrobium porci]